MMKFNWIYLNVLLILLIGQFNLIDSETNDDNLKKTTNQVTTYNGKFI